MNLKEPQPPGVDALIGIAEGLSVSIDWIVGRTEDHGGADFAREDYAVFCKSAVLHVLVRILDAVKTDPKGAIDAEAGRILGYEPHEVAAVAMLDFMAIVDLQAEHPSRPKDYFKRNFAALSDMAKHRVDVTSVRDLVGRKPNG